MKAIAGFSALLAEGRRLEAAQQWKEAASAYQKIIDQDAANSQAVPRLLIVYRKLKDFRKELSVIDGALAAYSEREKAAQQKWIAAHPQAARAGKAVLKGLGALGTSALGEDSRVAALLKRREFVERRVGGKKKAAAHQQLDPGGTKKTANANGKAAAKKQAAERAAKQLATAAKAAERAAAKEQAAAERAEKATAAKAAKEQAAEARTVAIVAKKQAAAAKKAAAKPSPLLFVITLRYLVYPDKLAAETPAHNTWLDKHFESGTFLAAGLQNPPLGETIIATGKSGKNLHRLVHTDPYLRKKWATVDIMEFSAARMGKRWPK